MERFSIRLFLMLQSLKHSVVDILLTFSGTMFIDNIKFEYYFNEICFLVAYDGFLKPNEFENDADFMRDDLISTLMDSFGLYEFSVFL